MQITINSIIQSLNARLFTESADLTSPKISTFYCGDFLSRVISKAPAGAGWLTIMGNLNAVGVAVLAEIPLIILCEGVLPLPGVAEKAEEEGISLISTGLSAYDAAVLLSRLG